MVSVTAYSVLFFIVVACPPVSTLFPYTTLFRSHGSRRAGSGRRRTRRDRGDRPRRSEEHTPELQSPVHLVCRRLPEKKNKRSWITLSVRCGSTTNRTENRIHVTHASIRTHTSFP